MDTSYAVALHGGRFGGAGYPLGDLQDHCSFAWYGAAPRGHGRPYHAKKRIYGGGEAAPVPHRVSRVIDKTYTAEGWGRPSLPEIFLREKTNLHWLAFGCPVLCILVSLCYNKCS